MRLECGNALRYEFGRPQVVARCPHEVFASGTLEDPHGIGGHADIGFLPLILYALIAGAKFPTDRFRVVGRAIVRDYYLEVFVVLCLQALERLTNKSAFVA